MLFKATEAQVRKIAQNALEAMGVKIPVKQIAMDRMGPKAGVFIDSMLGKKVSLCIKRMAKPVWYLPDTEPPKSAGWTATYKTYKDLVKSVEGVEIFGPVDTGVPAKDDKKVDVRKTELNHKVEDRVAKDKKEPAEEEYKEEKKGIFGGKQKNEKKEEKKATTAKK